MKISHPQEISDLLEPIQQNLESECESMTKSILSVNPELFDFFFSSTNRYYGSAYVLLQRPKLKINEVVFNTDYDDIPLSELSIEELKCLHSELWSIYITL
jgi:hypothetical protein